MAYENCGVIVIIAKRVLNHLRSRFPNTARVPDLARNVQLNSPLRHLRVFLTDRRCPSLRNLRQAPWIFSQDDLSAALFSYIHGHLKAEVSYSMDGARHFASKHDIHSRSYRATLSSRLSGSHKAPTSRTPGNLSQIFTGPGVCTVMNDLANSSSQSVGLCDQSLDCIA
jgi:hypothetical protein